MTQCRNCQLSFEKVNEQGLCEGCAQELGLAPKKDAELDAMRKQLEATEQRMKQLEGSLRGTPPAAPAPPDVADVNKRIWQNPAQSVAEMVYAGAQQVVGQQMAMDHETMVAVARDKAKEMSGDAELFDKYRTEIEQRVAAQPPAYHRNVNVWVNAAQGVYGSHARELRYEQKDAANEGKPKAPAIRTTGDGPAPPSPRSASAPRTEPLSDEAREMARRFRMSEEKFRQGMQAYENQGDPQDPTKPSSWDQVFSFGPEGRKKKEKVA